MADLDSRSAVDPVLLRFRKSGGILIVATAAIVFPALAGVTMVVGGVLSHDASEWGTGIGLTAAFGIFAAVFLYRQFRRGTLTAMTLTLPTGFIRHATVPLSEIDDVGMLYTVPAGWLQYIWRADGTALRLPLFKLGNYPPGDVTQPRDWQLIADTQQGRTCLAIRQAVLSAHPAKRAADPVSRHAGRPQEISFWSADTAVGITPLDSAPVSRRMRAFSIAMLVFLFLVLAGMMAAGIFGIRAGVQTRAQQRPVAGWVTTSGTVVDIQNVPTKDGYVYGPVISFIDAAGTRHRFTAPTGSDIPVIGETAEVSYNPHDPTLAHDLSASDETWKAPFWAGIAALTFGFLSLLGMCALSVHFLRRKGDPEPASES